MFMNAYEIEEHNDRVYMRSFHYGEALPNTYTAAETLLWLMHWADHNSDGWAYWPKPIKAAQTLIQLLEAYNGTRWDAVRTEEGDIPTATLNKALRPIKAFLTRQGIPLADRPEELR